MDRRLWIKAPLKFLDGVGISYSMVLGYSSLTTTSYLVFLGYCICYCNQKQA
ncbi:MAG: hypothetical protein QXN01_00740 [Candidatus Anstonellales archaeon]